MAIYYAMGLLRDENKVWLVLDGSLIQNGELRFIAQELVDLQAVALYLVTFNICHTIMLTIVVRILGQLREGELERSDIAILVYHTDIIMQTMLWYRISIMCLFPPGTWINNLAYRMFGVTLQICGSDAPIILGHVADATQVEIGKGAVIAKQGKLIGHVFERGAMQWNKVSVGDKCLCEGQLMANHKMLEGSSIGPKSTPMREPCQEGFIYAGCPMMKYDAVELEWYHDADAEVKLTGINIQEQDINEKTPLLATAK